MKIKDCVSQNNAIYSIYLRCFGYNILLSLKRRLPTVKKEKKEKFRIGLIIKKERIKREIKKVFQHSEPAHRV